MKMLWSPLPVLLSITVCFAQIRPPGPPAPPQQPPPATSDGFSGYLKQCAPGDLIPGPTCTSFLKCIGSRTQATRRVKYECAPGTIFNQEVSTCVHGDASQCVISAGPDTSAPWPPESVGPPSPASCPAYEPGTFPSYRDCVGFYKCIVTMGCTIKGFHYHCPRHFLFDVNTKRCQAESVVGVCDKAADPGVQTHEIQPVVEIKQELLDDFFAASAYWDFMPFLPDEPQKIVPFDLRLLPRSGGRRLHAYKITPSDL
ncbi:putative Chitin binding Peritrophin-A domain-containing protein 31 [Homarus americanus]|uniref:Putative Chitin binding Peritrophin-A domain-containing protein 31 n=1 Tax=Homarus americanus TaxID=6706 RepID=A0A8J5N7J8_HOMAM|nr:putative Chitin binding Peritrophin-A domain-containing protein 31 [Homarus americanus]